MVQIIRLTGPGRSDIEPPSTAEHGEHAEWVDLDLDDPDDDRWLEDHGGLDDEALRRLREPARSTYWRQFGETVYINFRSASLEDVASEDSTVELGVCVGHRRLITTRRGRVPALQRAAAAYREGGGPSDPWELFASMLTVARDRLEGGLHALARVIDEIEDRLLHSDEAPPIDQLVLLHRRLIYARRYKLPLIPLVEFVCSRPALRISQAAQTALKDLATDIAQHEQLLEFLMARAEALQDSIQNQLADSMNKVMYRFTWVATAFLPLGFITGLLGINVAGIPGTHDPFAFWLVCSLLVLTGVAWASLVARLIR